MITRILKNPWVEWEPHPVTGYRGPSEKQLEFLLQLIEEVLYGGAVRGGKSWALLVAAAMYLDVPNYSAIIFRKQKTMFTDMADSLLDLSFRWGWDDKGAHYNAGALKWTFPSGATIRFGYMGDPRAQGHKRHKSAWYQAIFFDQVEEIPEVQYNYMNSRLGRLEGQDVPIRFWSTANPDGFEWVYDHFVKKETKDPATKFIPATADDNPYIDMAAFEKTMQKLDPITFQQLRKGVWGLSTSGGMFDMTDFVQVQVLPVGQPLIGIRYWDLAATDEMEGGTPAYSAGVRMFRDLSTNNVYVDNVQLGRWSPLQVETMMANTAALDKKMVTDLQVRYIETHIEQEPGASGKAVIDHYLRDPLAGYAAYGDKPTGSKEDRARPWAACVAAKRAHVVLGTEPGSALWIDGYRQEHRRFPGGQYKDRVDASSGAYNKLFDIGREPKFGVA